MMSNESTSIMLQGFLVILRVHLNSTGKKANAEMHTTEVIFFMDEKFPISEIRLNNNEFRIVQKDKDFSELIKLH